MRKVIYTAIFGGKDTLIPAQAPEHWDLVCFTDAESDALNGYVGDWRIRRIMRITSEPRMMARDIKSRPHIWLPDYDVSIWIDGNIEIVGDMNFFIASALMKNDMAVPSHLCTKIDRRDSLREEVAAIIRLSKDDPKVVQRQYDSYISQGFPEHEVGLAATTQLARRHTDQVARFNNLWFDQIKKFSIRDQMSFNYAAWKTGTPFSYLGIDIRSSPYFKMHKHLHRK